MFNVASSHFGPSRPVLNVLADSDEESSSAASSDEDEPPSLSEPQGPVGEKGTTPPADGWVLIVSNKFLLALPASSSCSRIFGKISSEQFARCRLLREAEFWLLATADFYD